MSMPVVTRSMAGKKRAQTGGARLHASAGPSRNLQRSSGGRASAVQQGGYIPAGTINPGSMDQPSQQPSYSRSSDESEEEGEEEDVVPSIERDPADRRSIVYAVIATFDRDRLTPGEIMSQFMENKAAFQHGRVAEAVHGLVHNDRALRHLEASIGRVEGEYWGPELAKSLKQRATYIFQAFTTWTREPQQQAGSVINTASALFALFHSIAQTMQQYRHMQGKHNMVAVFLWIAERVVALDQDVRRPGGAGIVYAGGAMHFEHNLFRHFASAEKLDRSFWGPLESLIRSYPRAFQTNEASESLRRIQVHLQAKVSDDNAEVRAFILEFANKLRMIMASR